VDSSKRSADGDGRAGDSHRFIVNLRGDAEIEHLKQLIFEKTGLSSKRQHPVPRGAVPDDSQRKFGLHAYDAARSSCRGSKRRLSQEAKHS
jgi:hypothetical protein